MSENLSKEFSKEFVSNAFKQGALEIVYSFDAFDVHGICCRCGEVDGFAFEKPPLAEMALREYMNTVSRDEIEDKILASLNNMNETDRKYFLNVIKDYISRVA